MSYEQMIRLYQWLISRPDVYPGSWTYRKMGIIIKKMRQIEKEMPRKSRPGGNYV